MTSHTWIFVWWKFNRLTADLLQIYIIVTGMKGLKENIFWKIGKQRCDDNMLRHNFFIVLKRFSFKLGRYTVKQFSTECSITVYAKSSNAFKQNNIDLELPQYMRGLKYATSVFTCSPLNQTTWSTVSR